MYLNTLVFQVPLAKVNSKALTFDRNKRFFVVKKYIKKEYEFWVYENVFR